MGAALSIPLMPVQLAGTWLSSFLGAACCTAFANMMNVTFQSSVATRVCYATIFLLNSIFSWISLSRKFLDKIEKISFGRISFGEGASFFIVQRINFALALFHVSLALILVGVRSTRDPRAKIQNGLWSMKVLVWWALIIFAFFVPEGFFKVYGNYIALAGACIFNLIGLILLVDFAHEWSEMCLDHIHTAEYSAIHLDEDDDDDLGQVSSSNSNAKLWTWILVGGTIGMYVVAVALTVIMYVIFAKKGCSLNTTFITLNLVLTIVVSLMSVHPVVRDHNPANGLGQAGMVSVYCTYLIMSACCSEPDSKCNPVVRSQGTKTVNILLSSVFTFMAIAYTTTRAAANSNFRVEHEDSMDLRIQTIRQAVSEGALPESALEDPSWYLDNVDSSSESGDEAHATKYNYAVFHVIFMLATQFIATLLTINVTQNDLDFAPVGRTHFYSIVKMVSALVCYLLYAWSLMAPVWFPERFSVSL